MRRSTRGAPSTPPIQKPAMIASPQPPPQQQLTSMWKEFERAPDQQRELFARRIELNVNDVKESLAEFEAARERSFAMNQKLNQLQMKFKTMHEKLALQQALEDSSDEDEINELFGVDIAARNREVASIGLPPIAEAHVGAAVREWQAKVDETTWAKQVRSALDEEAELLARKKELRASIDAKKKQLETLRNLKNGSRLNECATSEEAVNLLTSELCAFTLKNEVKDEDLKSELSTPPSSPCKSDAKKEESEYDDDDEFLDTI
ncbi:hypothetical protein PMAYCL1PPCAC_14019 [Pristionchus mayeri]|uniref:Uncharacterized protein n=1 Tax=Pristionchus mayeri TaxID=1317129 RepID=A0AAN4ZPU6_9BILA|nr:hypothetical protein PMAYCL1PPCAC_14019 [Pristionchus mayeri]